MSDPKHVELISQLKLLLERVKLTFDERHLAKQCLRRLEHPLRLTIFGTDPEYAIPLLNLLIGQSVVSPSLQRARIQFFHSDVPYAKLQYRNGTHKRLEGRDFRRLFEDNPSRMRIYVNLPVLRRMSILLALDKNPKALCADAKKTLLGADIAIWTGDLFTDGMRDVWDRVPATLLDHTYLALAQRAEIDPWYDVEKEFVSVLRVNPIRAHNAKTSSQGVDKDAFRAAGGTLIVKAMKSEIEMLVRSAEDTATLLLARRAGDLATAMEQDPHEAHESKRISQVAPTVDEPSLAARITPNYDELPSLDEFDPALVGRMARRPKSMPKTSARNISEPRASISQFPLKNMPVRRNRPLSKLGSKPRVRSDSPRPGDTPFPPVN